MTYKEKYRLERKNRRDFIFNTFNGRCAYCGKFFDNDFTIDHVKPLKRKCKSYKGLTYSEYQELPETQKRGSDTIENIMPCCISCNCSKSDLSLDDFRKRLVKKTGNETVEFLFETLKKQQ